MNAKTVEEIKKLRNEELQKEYKVYIDILENKLEIFLPLFEEVTALRVYLASMSSELFNRGFITLEQKKELEK